MPYPTLDERKREKVARMRAAVDTLAEELGAYAREHGGRFILFGSAARGELRPDSDVDVAADFPPDAASRASGFAEGRAAALGLKPDVQHLDWMGERLRERIAREGRELNAAPIHTRGRVVPEGKTMKDARWIDIHQDCEAASRHFRSGARVFRELERLGPEDLDRLMALLHYMQSAHTSLEAALLRILQILDEAPPTGPDWHARLITRCATAIPGSRPAILSPELARDAQNTRAFRHLAMHGYDIEFDLEKAQRAIEPGLRLAEAFPARIEAFAHEIDPG